MSLPQACASQVAVQAVETLSVHQIRTAFRCMRECGGEPHFWTRVIPDIGMTVAEFSMGYVLRLRAA